MNGMTIGEMLRACRGEWQGNKDTLDKTPVSVVTDSRQAGEGSLFLALRGERTDGHRYIPDVLRKGALAVLCEERGAAGEPRIVVPDTLAAMQQIAAAIPVVAARRIDGAGKDLAFASQRVAMAARQCVANERQRVMGLEKQVELLSPDRVLRRGYSLTLRDGHVVTSASSLRAGDSLVTRFADGERTSVVE